jgi:hypothetical protein
LPFPLMSFDIGMEPEGDESLFLLISKLTLRGRLILFRSPLSLPLRSTCKLALVDPECLLCLCSGSVNNGYSPPVLLGPPSSFFLDERMGWYSGTAITSPLPPLSSPDELLFLLLDFDFDFDFDFPCPFPSF